MNKNNLGYQRPPKAISDLIDISPTPGVSISPSGEWLLFLNRPSLPSIAILAQEELKLAGIRINPKTNGASRSNPLTGLYIQSLKTGEEKNISGLPESPQISNISWSPKGNKIAFTHTKETGLELWIIDLNTAIAQQLTTPILNDAIGSLPYTWFSDEKSIIIKTIAEDRGKAPVKSPIPNGPNIQESEANAAPVRTYQDLLKNKYDEELFTYYTKSQIKVIDLTNGNISDFGLTGIISGISTSPNGEYVLISEVQEPFSYLVPYSKFPIHYTLYQRDGTAVEVLAKIPHSENIPKGFGAVRTGKRSFSWRADHPATITWVEAQDEGNPAKQVDTRDTLYSLTAPFTDSPKVLFNCQLRFGGVDWYDNEFAICYEWWWTDRRIISTSFSPASGKKQDILHDRSWEDHYNDPGSFLSEKNQYGRSILMKRDKHLYLSGIGASPRGNEPFVDTYEISTKTTNRIWQSQAPYYERPVHLKYIDEGILYTIRESQKERPNYFKRELYKNSLEQITFFENPYKSLEDVQKELIKYKRKDGVALTGTLYTPPAYNPEKDGRLPVLMWAYPREYKSADAAGQVKESPYEFIHIAWYSPLFWVTQGYAILDDFSMPIIGEGEEEPNQRFVEQLVMDAEAAIQTLDDRGIADLNRIAVGGHSYGAFMTANLLAHTDLFAAGIARSGAYNRTLTPFGFQSEERTFWEAPDTYFKMSPFVNADKINTPILLIHGDADNNSGTYPMQSERFFKALKGQGRIARLVLLPHESHSYQAYESILHMLWEQHEWLEKYVKNRS